MSLIHTILPIPSAILLFLLTIYHLTPLLSLLGKTSLTPSLTKLASIIPHPPHKRKRNLPREFFNLPPRPGSPLPPSSLLSSIQRLRVQVGSRLALRGKIILVLSVEGIVSLACGWEVLSSTNTSTTISDKEWSLVGISIILLPTTIAWFSIFSIISRYTTNNNNSKSKSNSITDIIFDKGGITHSTLLPRILPISLITSLIPIVLIISLSAYAQWIILGITSLDILVIASCGLLGCVARERSGGGTIKLPRRASSPLIPTEKTGVDMVDDLEMNDQERMRRMIADGSWVSSPSRPPTPTSSFTYSPSTAASFKTPKSKPSSSTISSRGTVRTLATAHEGDASHKEQDDNDDNDCRINQATTLTPHGETKDQSWLSEPINTPSTISEWDFPSPEPAHTRPRSPISPNLPHERANPRSSSGPVRSSDSTTYTHTLTSTPGIHSPGGSILADYSPDPFHPLPRAYESLTSYPLSPSQLADSRASLVQVLGSRGQSSTSIACVPVERFGANGSSTFSLQTYHSPLGRVDEDSYKTPNGKGKGDRRAPPPPPMPVDMPLPPTPTVARSSTLWEASSGQGGGKDSMELLISGPERDWVEVERDVDGEEWGRSGQGVGVVAAVGTVVCFGLAVPLLLNGFTSLSTTLYLISIILPSPIITLTSYLLRYRPPPASTRGAKGSTMSSATNMTGYRSLALVSASQLSLPLSISPKLTPPAPKRSSTLDIARPRLGKLLEPKPSLTTFGYNSDPHTPAAQRRHTIYGGAGLSIADIEADERMRRAMARRSGDVWIESGHAIVGGGIFARAAEMLKPVPAMRVFDDAPTQRVRDRDTKGLVKRLRGGVVSMLSNRASALFGVEESANDVDDVEMGGGGMGQFEDALSEYGSPARSNIEISIIGPSPKKKSSSNTLNLKRASYLTTDTTASSFEHRDDSLPTAEIRQATRGRMSHGPTIIFPRGEARNSQRDGEGYELDWMTAGVLPGLVPFIKIGKEVRVEPGPNSAPLPDCNESEAITPPARHRPLSDIGTNINENERLSNSEYSPFGQGLKDHSTPHRFKSNCKSKSHNHTHTRSYSSSVDLTMSSEYHTAATSTSTSANQMRHRKSTSITTDIAESNTSSLKHKKSFGLPTFSSEFEEEDFESKIRKSLDDLSIARPSEAELDDAGDAGAGATYGVDLPPFPTTIAHAQAQAQAHTLTHRPSLSRVSERSEEPSSFGGDSQSDTSVLFSTSAIEDMEIALKLGATPVSQKSNSTLRISPTNTNLSPGASTTKSSLGDESFVTTGSAADALEEMERMMAMDTPTRAEFVISPPPSSYDDTTEGRESRSSDRSSIGYASTSFTGNGSIISTSYGGYEMYSYAPAVPPVPSIPENYRPVSHPYPPPSSNRPSSQLLANSTSLADLKGYTITQPHPPLSKILPRTRKSKSSETIRSDYTSSTTTATATPTSSRYKIAEEDEEEFTISERELKRLSLLKERNGSRTIPLDKRRSRILTLTEQKENDQQAQVGNNDNNEKEVGVQVKRSSGLRPLQLVSERGSNTTHSQSSKKLPNTNKGLQIQNGNGVKVPVLVQTYEGKSKSTSPKKVSKMSTNTGKENMRGKMSTGSAAVVRGLRA